MRRTWKRAFALFLCLVMCLSLFPASAFAEGDVAEEPADPVVLSDGEGSQEGEAAGEAISLPQTEKDVGQLIAAPTDDPTAPAGADASSGPEDTEFLFDHFIGLL